MTLPALRRAVGPLLGAVLLAGTAGCTSEPREATAPPVTEPATPSTSRPPVVKPSAPLKVKVTHVAGTLRARERRALTRRVGRTIRSYVDAAFLRGPYPRSDFSSSFGAFTSRAVGPARGDRLLLTNKPLGSTTESVRATRRTAYLSVLAPRRHPAGVTAAVHLVLRVERVHGAPRRVSLKGRLLLSRDRHRTWKIFGYDLHRSTTGVRSAT